jgi:hypothetical protein
MEQWSADDLFGCPNLLTECRLANVQPPSRAGEAQFFGYRQEVT